MTAIQATFRLRREGALRSRAARGDAAAFAAVYERHHLALYRYCRSILRHEEDAQDALQSTFTRAFAALQTEQRDFELRPWLFRIAHNEAISVLRRRPPTDELADVPDYRPFEDRIADREELRLLALDLADLPERQRAALVLRELNGLSHAEIGVVLELSTSAVKQAIFEARSALFSCREGREMDCMDIRRMLSDGDGRVLRGRGVRAHLRSCDGCRRFREDLTQRPKALRALVPPLPVGAAGALLAEILGGATAAKLLACVAIAGGGATLAVELRDVRHAPPAAVAEETKPKPKRAPPPPAPSPAAAIPAVAATASQSQPAAAPKPKAKPRPKAKPKRKPRPVPKRHARPEKPHKPKHKDAPPRGRDAAPGRAKDHPRGKSEQAPGRAKREQAPGRTKREQAPGRVKREQAPGRVKREQAPGRVKREQAPGLEKREKAPGRAHQATPPVEVPPPAAEKPAPKGKAKGHHKDDD